LSVEAHDRFIYLGGSAHLAAAVPVRARRVGRKWLVPASTTPAATDDRAKGGTGENRGRIRNLIQGKPMKNMLERH
jgi:hypothetical protein